MAVQKPVDVVLLGSDWRVRAPLRAQLIEDGYEVLATDTWTDARRCLRPGVKPRLFILDLAGLSDPETILHDTSVLMNARCVLVLTALGAPPRERVQRLGFEVMARPITNGEVAAAAAMLLERCPGGRVHAVPVNEGTDQDG